MIIKEDFNISKYLKAKGFVLLLDTPKKQIFRKIYTNPFFHSMDSFAHAIIYRKDFSPNWHIDLPFLLIILIEEDITPNVTEPGVEYSEGFNVVFQGIQPPSFEAAETILELALPDNREQ